MTDVMPVSDTALVTLWCRAAEARRDDALLDDPMAVRLVDSLDYDFDRFRLSADRQDLGLRALAFDTAVRDYLATHPRATVVALGEGLQTSFWRLDGAGDRSTAGSEPDYSPVADPGPCCGPAISSDRESSPAGVPVFSASGTVRVNRSPSRSTAPGR